jgi:hypothetical protein
MFYQSKYQRKHTHEARRERQIQDFMTKNNWSRKRAVHQFDYDKEIKKQTMWSKYINI